MDFKVLTDSQCTVFIGPVGIRMTLHSYILGVVLPNKGVEYVCDRRSIQAGRRTFFVAAPRGIVHGVDVLIRHFETKE